MELNRLWKTLMPGLSVQERRYINAHLDQVDRVKSDRITLKELEMALNASRSQSVGALNG